MTVESMEKIKGELKRILGDEVKVITINEFFSYFNTLKEFLEIANEFTIGYSIEKYNCSSVPFEFFIFVGMRGYDIAWVKKPGKSSYNLVLIGDVWYIYHPETRTLENFKTPEPGSVIIL